MSITAKQETLYQALTDIDPSLLAEAFPRVMPRTSRRLERLGAVAALIALLLGVLFMPIKSPTMLLVSGTFILESNTYSEHTMGDNLFEQLKWKQLLSATTPGFKPTPLFGEKKIFSIEIRPSDMENIKHIELHYNLRVQYGDTVVGLPMQGRDPHISWGFVSGTDNEPSCFCLSGWFEDPTDLKITIMDKDGNVVQDQTIHIEYNSFFKFYDITVVEVIDYQ